MKQRLLATVIGGMAFMVLFAGFASAQGGELVKAEYGAGGRRVDVTPQVRSFLHDGVLRFDVTDQVLGTDPARNHVKELFIAIRHWDGKVEEIRYPEYAHVNLVLDPERGYEYHDRDLHIVRAFYGGAGHFVDVTETLRHMTRDGHVIVMAENATFGGDPDPNVVKMLRVLYFHDGQRRQKVVPEHGELRLP
jgi:hypothetical protein